MGTRRLTAALAALVPLLGAGSDAAKVFQIPFTTDLDYFDEGVYGPDGPWQAAAVVLGTQQRKSLAEPMEGPPVAMWPTSLAFSQLLTFEAGGLYNVTDDAKADTPWCELGNGGDNEMREADFYGNHYTEGVGVIDAMTLVNRRLEEPGYVNVNATIYAMNSSRVELADGRSYTPEIGTLGLGRPDDINFIVGSRGTSMVEQMKTAGMVTSNSFGLHMGSAALGQRASLIIGGYDENRVLEPVGIFQTMRGIPVIFLHDVTMGVETGRWPFNTTEQDMEPIWAGTTDKVALEGAGLLGGKTGSVVVTPNPAVPGIYLPGETCANAAQHLPITWDDKLGYYLWNTEDPTYYTIINSGAYLGFVFSDTQSTNVTIKVPFTLLNLTLTSPIVDTPTPYFPCFDADSQGEGYWELGRAFLQAAFFGISYEQNVTFLAQAPGPSMDQSIVHTLEVDDTSLVAKPSASFAASWQAHWPAAVEEDDVDSGTTSSSSRSGLSTGAIAGIVVGVVVGLALVGFVVFFFLRKRKQAAAAAAGQEELSELGTEDNTSVQGNQAAAAGGTPKQVHEMGENFVTELDSPEKKAAQVVDSPATLVQELDSPHTMVQELHSPMEADRVIHEAPTSPGVCELPAEPVVPREPRQGQE